MPKEVMDWRCLAYEIRFNCCMWHPSTVQHFTLRSKIKRRRSALQYCLDSLVSPGISTRTLTLHMLPACWEYKGVSVILG